MFENLLLGGMTMVVCVAIQCVVVSLVLRTLFRLDRRQILKPTVLHVSCLLSVVLLVLLGGNLIQMAAWAGLFTARGEFEEFGTAWYHSVVNFTTLGYGDLVMSETNRLLGGLEAANGVLMFGLTTGVLFAVLSALIDRAWEQRVTQEAKHSRSHFCRTDNN
jgi:hypothetical protein